MRLTPFTPRQWEIIDSGYKPVLIGYNSTVVSFFCKEGNHVKYLAASIDYSMAFVSLIVLVMPRNGHDVEVEAWQVYEDTTWY